jgi:hypothetical protein
MVFDEKIMKIENIEVKVKINITWGNLLKLFLMRLCGISPHQAVEGEYGKYLSRKDSE